MLIDELREKIKQAEPDIKMLETYWQNSGLESEYSQLDNLTKSENFWQDPNQTEILKKLHKVKQQKEHYDQIIKLKTELSELITLFEEDPQELEKIKEELNKWIKSISLFKINALLSDELDNSNCFLSINSGAGGTESQDWADMLLRMYIRFSERQDFSVTILDYQPGEAAGIKSATIFAKGKNAYGLLKNEQGIHRLVRISPFDANKRRHTSFAAVTAIPEIQKIQINIDPNDLKIDTFRAGGAGGQHVNKTESAIRITHLPTNIVVQCQNERSQTQNKDTAMKMLLAKLTAKQREAEKEKESAKEKKKIEWGSQIRSYILHPYKLVKDHRTEIENQQPELVLDGDITDFIEANLIREQTHA